LKLQGRSGSYEIPTDIDVDSAFARPAGLSKATLFLRDGRGLNLRNRGVEISGDRAPVGWQEYVLEYRDHERFVEEVLWYGSDVIVSEPQTLRYEILAHLKSGVVRYG
jgi:proteasome accessory factor B